MEGILLIEIIKYLLIITIAILNIILFFKIWRMTNDVNILKDFLLQRFQKSTQSSVSQSIDDDGIPSSRKYTRASDGKKILLKYMIGDEYECVDPVTNESLGRFKNYEIKKGW
jgi:hypothetical protein